MARKLLDQVPKVGDVIYNAYRQMSVLVTEVHKSSQYGYWIYFDYFAIRLSDGKEDIYSNGDPWTTDVTWGPKWDGKNLWYRSSKKDVEEIRKSIANYYEE